MVAITIRIVMATTSSDPLSSLSHGTASVQMDRVNSIDASAIVALAWIIIRRQTGPWFLPLPKQGTESVPINRPVLPPDSIAVQLP